MRSLQPLTNICTSLALVLITFATPEFIAGQDTAANLEDKVDQGFVQSGDVKIHYATMGEGPLVILIHGFPDYWYSWREQIPTLAKNFKVVAIDQRGYNLSDQPEGVDNYSMPKLTADIKAVADHFNEDKPIIVGHDWGGAVAWNFAISYADSIERLVILNLPHFNGLSRELANNSDQQAASAYARRFQEANAASGLSAEGLAFWVKDDKAKAKYVAAFKRSSFEGMLNFYKANYPREPYQAMDPAATPNVQCKVLMIHGLKDTALLPSALNDTWQWIDNELTLVTIPEAGHFVQQDASQRVTRVINNWLLND